MLHNIVQALSLKYIDIQIILIKSKDDVLCNVNGVKEK